ncbi:MAG: hypothetical protein QY321_03875 [Patescibacteria group bacterium]|nr:MAG: hypothetical protein QY321_03875 [Patescibacteria group bacterium]
MTLYRTIIKQAFIVAWNHKYLWFFGLFATLLSSNFEFQFFSRFLNRDQGILNDWQKWSSTGLFDGSLFRGFNDLMVTNPGDFFGLLALTLFVLAFSCALIWLSTVSQVALINNSDRAIASGHKLNSSERKHDMSLGFREGIKYFWPALGLYLLSYAVIYIFTVIAVLPLLIWNEGIWVSFAYWVLFIFMIGLSLCAALTVKYAMAYLVLKKKSLMESIRAGLKLFVANWLISLEMAFILFAISIIGTLIILLLVVSLAIPFVALALIAVVVKSLLFFYIVAFLGAIALLALIIIGGAVLTVIQTNAWVNLFNNINTSKVVSKLERTLG